MLHEVPMDLTEKQLGQGRSSAVTSKVGIANGEYVLQITMTCKDFKDIHDIISCCGQDILVIVGLLSPLLVLWGHGALIQDVLW